MIETVALALSIAAFVMSFMAWVILRKLCSALSELASDLQKWAEETEAEYQRAAARDNLLKRARLKN